MSEQRNPPVTVKNEENLRVDDSVPLQYAGRDQIVECLHYMRESNSNSDPETRRCRFTERKKEREKKKFLHLQTVCTILLLICCLWLSIHNKKLKERPEREKNVI